MLVFRRTVIAVHCLHFTYGVTLFGLSHTLGSNTTQESPWELQHFFQSPYDSSSHSRIPLWLAGGSWCHTCAESIRQTSCHVLDHSAGAHARGHELPASGLSFRSPSSVSFTFYIFFKLVSLPPIFPFSNHNDLLKGRCDCAAFLLKVLTPSSLNRLSKVSSKEHVPIAPEQK